MTVPPPTQLSKMTQAQRDALRRLCDRRGIVFDEDRYHPQFDLPPGYVAGWVGNLYVGVSPDGEVSS